MSLARNGWRPMLEMLADWCEPWQWEALRRMVLCAVIGGTVGLEREYHGRAAGFRTHILVCLGCGIIMIASTHFVRLYGGLPGDSVVRLDPARLAYGVVTGVGFLGAGVIMKTGTGVHGLTTAASLWSVSALGLATGLGMYRIAIVGALMTLVTLVTLRHVSNWVPAHHYRVLRITVPDAAVLPKVRTLLQAAGATILRAAIDQQADEARVEARYELRFRDDRAVEDLLRAVQEIGTFMRVVIE